MTFTPFKAKFGKNDIVSLKEDMASYRSDGGIFSTGHKFKIATLYIASNHSSLRHYGVLQPVASLPEGVVPFIYNLQDLDDPKLMVQCEEVDLKLVKRGDPNEQVERPVYTQIAKDKTTTHKKPRTDVKDTKLKKQLKEAREEEAKEAAKPKNKLGLNLRNRLGKK